MFTMVGRNVITKCPFCGKVLRQNIGITDYYRYDDKKVRVTGHFDCNVNPDGSFITMDYDDLNLTRYAFLKSFEEDFLADVRAIVFSNLANGYDEDKMREVVVHKLGKRHDATSINRNMNDIKVLIEIIMGQINVDAMYTRPFDQTVKSGMRLATRCCY